MAVQEITFQHWFIETQNLIPEYMYRTINPYTMKFLKADGVYFAIGVTDPGVMDVFSTIGSGLQGFRDLVTSCKNNGITMLRFGCSANNSVVQAIYRYAGAKKVGEQEKFYSNGDTLFKYELNIAESKRFNKEK
jgi:hypothetical protein